MPHFGIATGHSIYPLSPSRPPRWTPYLTGKTQIKDEYTFITSLAAHLSQRYSRPQSSILVQVEHSTCLFFGGSFDPAYIITITALPSQVQPTLNKRNAALIQAFLADELPAPESRGVVKFVSVAEENLATGGVTVLGQIESLQAQKSTLPRTPASIRASSGGPAAKSTPNFSRKGTPEPPPKPAALEHEKQERRARPNTPKESAVPAQRKSSKSRTKDKHVDPLIISPPMPALPPEKSPLDIQAEKTQKVGRRKSFARIFGR
jgi:hypothetical protein